ncbi:hypothetical protein F5Y01DRAFT_328523 [Xylaria sp. FL0043]|nr:hypothetical protein F5Y01DRAFT_328523 [Xylaria sp. FL0043]
MDDDQRNRLMTIAAEALALLDNLNPEAITEATEYAGDPHPAVVEDAAIAVGPINAVNGVNAVDGVEGGYGVDSDDAAADYDTDDAAETPAAPAPAPSPSPVPITTSPSSSSSSSPEALIIGSPDHAEHAAAIAPDQSPVLPPPATPDPMIERALALRKFNVLVHPSLLTKIDIPQFWRVSGRNWRPAAKILAQLPAQRRVTKLRNAFRGNPFEWNITAAVGQCVGRVADVPCTLCLRAGEQFGGGCIVSPEGVDYDGKRTCCYSCLYHNHYTRCSLDRPALAGKETSK